MAANEDKDEKEVFEKYNITDDDQKVAVRVRAAAQELKERKTKPPEKKKGGLW